MFVHRPYHPRTRVGVRAPSGRANVKGKTVTFLILGFTAQHQFSSNRRCSKSCRRGRPRAPPRSGNARHQNALDSRARARARPAGRRKPRLRPRAGWWWWAVRPEGGTYVRDTRTHGRDCSEVGGARSLLWVLSVLEIASEPPVARLAGLAGWLAGWLAGQLGEEHEHEVCGGRGGWRRYTARAHATRERRGRGGRRPALPPGAASEGWVRGWAAGTTPAGLTVGSEAARTAATAARARSVGCVRLVGDTGRSSAARPRAARTVPRQAGGCPPAVRRARGVGCACGDGGGV